MIFLLSPLICIGISIGLFELLEVLSDKVLNEYPVQDLKIDILSIFWIINTLLLIFNGFTVFLVIICIEAGLIK